MNEEQFYIWKLIHNHMSFSLTFSFQTFFVNIDIIWWNCPR